MAIKEIKREWSPCQLGYVKEFLLHTEEDLKNMPRCSVGSKATVSETDNEYVKTVDGWKLLCDCDEDGGTGGGGGVQPDWNQNDPNAADYVKNRTHYEKTVPLMEWDGNKEGLAHAVIDYGGVDMEFVRLSDAFPQEIHDGMGIDLIIHMNGEELPETGNMVEVKDFYGKPTLFYHANESVYFVPESSTDDGVFPAAGVWVADIAALSGDASAYIKSCKAEIIKTIDPKFLPAGGSGGGFIVNATVTMTDEAMGTAVVDRSLQEIKDAIMAGKYVTCHVKDTFGEGTTVLPMCVYRDTSVEFMLNLSGITIQIEVQPTITNVNIISG